MDRGLLALGKSGNWEIQIDESLEGEDQYFAQIQYCGLEVDFELNCLEYIKEKIIPFLESDGQEIEFGSFGHLGYDVHLIRDEGRLVFKMSNESGEAYFWLPIGCQEDFIECWQQIAEEIEDD